MSSHRKNTLVVDFSVLPKRLEPAKLMQFLEKAIKLKKADVKNIQLHNLKKCAFIEMNDYSTAAKLYQQHNCQHSLECDGIQYKIPVFVESNAINVRIHDLPPQMSNTVIFEHMQQYGKVITVYNEVWKHFFSGVPNGVRVVRMKMTKPVPSCIVINNESTTVSYPNQAKSCAQCNKKNHLPLSCAVASLREKEQNHHQTPTSNPTEQNNNNGATIDPIPIDTSDTDKAFDGEISRGNDDNDDGSLHSDDGDNNELESSSKNKRRLSTGTSSGTSEEDSQQRSKGCQKIGNTQEEKKFRGDDIPDSGWKVYNTRSRKKI
nr:uncharacterized protein LOC115265338 [Aedes albopictus]